VTSVNAVEPSWFPWLGILVYILFLVLIAVVLYAIVRLAVTHALRSHQRWQERRPTPESPPLGDVAGADG
jgi:hypothetical protein